MQPPRDEWPEGWGVQGWRDPAVGGVTPMLAAVGSPGSSVFSGVIYEHRVAIAGEKGLGSV